MADEQNRLAAALADRYDIERELGAGGMATVYLAKDLRHDRQVAIKVLRSDLAVSLGAERFLKEIRIAANITHPHVLPVHDSGEADGFLYYVMPFIDGESLRAKIDRDGELPIADAARILRDVVDALAAAHAQGVVHRDIKPDNVLLSGRHALVADFGVAKAVSEATGRHNLTTVGVALGTPHYMAPEQASADPHIDHRADLYAVGAMAYEMVTGKPPFAGEVSHQVLTAHLTRAPLLVAEHRPSLPPAFAELIMRCLEKKPADRWQTAAELIPKLDALSSSTDAMTPAHSQAVQAAASGRAAVGWIFGGLAVAVVFVVAIIGYALVAPSLRGSVELGQRAQVTREATLELDPALSPDGRFLAYAASEPGGEFKVFVRQTENGTPIAVAPDLESWQRFPAWSPDGERLTFGSSRGVEVVSALGGVPRVVTPGSTVGAASWSADGQRVTVARGRGLVVVPIEGGSETSLVEQIDLHSPAWSGDGRWIAYVRGNQTGVQTLGNISSSAIQIVSADGGDALDVTDASSFNSSPSWLGESSTLLFVSDREGGRDVYSVDIARDGDIGEARRVTTGLGALMVHASTGGAQIAYAVFNDRSNIWSMPIPDAGPVSAASATPLTSGTQIIEMFDVSSDGQWLAFDSNRSGNQDIFRQPVAGGPIEQLTSDPGDDFAPAFSPDMTELAFYSYRDQVPRQLLVMPAAGGAATRAIAEDVQATGPRWSRDGSSLLMRIWPSTLAVIRRDGGAWGTVEELADNMTGSFAEWSPDGQTIAYSSAGADEGLRLISSTGENARTIHKEPEAPGPQFYPQWSDDGRYIYFLDLRAAGIHRIPAEGGTPEQLVRFDAARPWHRYGFRVVNGRFYFTLGELESDIWVADVLR